MEADWEEEMVEVKELHNGVEDSQGTEVEEQQAQLKKQEVSVEKRKEEDQRMMMASQDLKTFQNWYQVQEHQEQASKWKMQKEEKMETVQVLKREVQQEDEEEVGLLQMSHMAVPAFQHLDHSQFSQHSAK